MVTTLLVTSHQRRNLGGPALVRVLEASTQHQSLPETHIAETAVEEELNKTSAAAEVAADTSQPETDPEENTLNALIDEGEGPGEDQEQDEGEGHPDECELAETPIALPQDDPAEDDRPESRRRSADIAGLMGGDAGAHASARGKKPKQPARPIPVNEQVAHSRDMERTIAQQADTLAALRQQLEEQEQETARMRAVVAARQPPAPARTSPGPSSSNSQTTGAGVGLLHATAQRSSPLATTNAPGPATAPVVRDGAAIPAVLLDLSFFKQKCNDAVNYFIGGAPASEQTFYPTQAQIRRKVQELYEDVGVPADMFNRVMADNPEREKIPLQKMSERRCNIFTATKPFAHGPGGFVSESKVALLVAENLAPTRRRTPSEWHAHFRDEVYGSNWHCDGSGHPFANRSFELSLCKGLGGKRCNRINVKIPAVATICHVVEWPMANHNGRANPSLDASDKNNRAAVAAKILVVTAWIKALLEAGEPIYTNEAPAGFVLGSGAVKILVEGFEAVSLPPSSSVLVHAAAKTSADAVDMLPAPIWFRIFHLLHLPPSQLDDPAILAKRKAPEDPTAKTARLAAREAGWIRSPGSTAWQPWGHPACSSGLTAWGQLAQLGLPANSSTGLTSQLGQLGRPASNTGATAWGRMAPPASNTGLTSHLGQLSHPANNAGFTSHLGHPASSTGLPSQLGHPAGSKGVTPWGQMGQPANNTGLTSQLGQLGHPASTTGPTAQLGLPASSAKATAWGQQGHPANSAVRAFQMFHAEFGQLGRPASSAGLTDWDHLGHPASSAGLAAQPNHPANSTGLTAWQAQGLPTNSSTELASQLGQLGHPASSAGPTAQLGLPANSTGVTAWGQMGHPASSAVRALQMFYTEFGQPGHPGSSAGLTAWDWQGHHPASSAQRGTGTNDHLTNTRVDCKPPVVLRKEGLTASEQHERNSDTYGASWALLCCALASKRLLNLVLRELHLGRGMWSLNKQCVNAAWLKSIRKLTLEHADFESLSFQFLGTITPQLHEFTLYEDGNIFRLRDAIGAHPHRVGLSIMAKKLVISCKSTAPLALHHLSLHGQERLVVSSLPLAYARVAYLDGPGKDEDGSSWTELLGTIAPTVEVLIVRHGMSLKRVDAEWGRLRSLGIVLPPWDKDARANNWEMGMGTDGGECEEHLDDGRLRFSWEDDPAIKARMRARRRMKKAFPKPPPICAPNLRFLFFPTRKACNAPTLAALRQDYPALALYCVVDRSFYWERKGKTVSNAPLEHVRSEKSGVWDEEEGMQRAKNVREKMHNVNRKLVEGYCAGEDQMYVLQYQ
ncbi:unnamed protein product [Closterium sp. Yama58-4]|nr:unnamed protein product [Closterium sp. Yama58-4]